MINIHRFSTALGVVSLAASATYLFIYLYRWEWNRALIAGVFLLVAQGLLMSGTLLHRLNELSRQLDRAAVAERAGRYREQVQNGRRPSTHRFEWLKQSASGTNVFVPVLLGAGLAVSGLAWLVERIARLTARPVAEARLIRRLDALAYPVGGLVVDDPEPPSPAMLLSRPRPAGRT